MFQALSQAKIPFYVHWLLNLRLAVSVVVGFEPLERPFEVVEGLFEIGAPEEQQADIAARVGASLHVAVFFCNPERAVTEFPRPRQVRCPDLPGEFGHRYRFFGRVLFCRGDFPLEFHFLFRFHNP